MSISGFAPTGEELKELRRERGLSRQEMALHLYNDETKYQRVGKIERGEVDIESGELMKWMFVCTDNDEAKKEAFKEFRKQMRTIFGGLLGRT